MIRLERFVDDDSDANTAAGELEYRCEQSCDEG